MRLLAGPDARDDRLDLHPTILSGSPESGAAARCPVSYRLCRADRNHRLVRADRDGPHRRARRRRARPAPRRPSTHRPARRRSSGTSTRARSTPLARGRRGDRPSRGREHRPALERRRAARVLDSRVNGTRLIAETAAGLASRPVLVCASATGFYGDRGDEIVDEDSRARHGVPGRRGRGVGGCGRARPCRRAPHRAPAPGHRALEGRRCARPDAAAVQARYRRTRRQRSPVVELGLPRRCRRRLSLRARAAARRARSTWSRPASSRTRSSSRPSAVPCTGRRSSRCPPRP